MIRFSFGQGGVMVIGNDLNTEFCVVELVNFTHCYSKQPWLAQELIGEQLVLKECGLSLPDDVLAKWFGEDFVSQRDELFMGFKLKQLEFKAFPLKRIQELFENVAEIHDNEIEKQMLEMRKGIAEKVKYAKSVDAKVVKPKDASVIPNDWRLDKSLIMNVTPVLLVPDVFTCVVDNKICLVSKDFKILS